MYQRYGGLDNVSTVWRFRQAPVYLCAYFIAYKTISYHAMTINRLLDFLAQLFLSPCYMTFKIDCILNDHCVNIRL